MRENSTQSSDPNIHVHRQIALQLALQCWMRGKGEVVVPSEYFKEALGISRLERSRAKYLQTALEVFFEEVVPDPPIPDKKDKTWQLTTFSLKRTFKDGQDNACTLELREGKREGKTIQESIGLALIELCQGQLDKSKIEKYLVNDDPFDFEF